MMRASERRRRDRARGRRGGRRGCGASRWPSRPASPRRSTGPRPRRCSTSRARPGRDAFRRAIGVALKDEEDLALPRPAGSTRSSRRRRRERARPPARRAALRRLPGAAARQRLRRRARADHGVHRRRPALLGPALDRGRPPRGARDARAAAGAPRPSSTRCSIPTSSKARRSPRRPKPAGESDDEVRVRDEGEAARSRPTRTRPTRPAQAATAAEALVGPALRAATAMAEALRRLRAARRPRVCRGGAAHRRRRRAPGRPPSSCARALREAVRHDGEVMQLPRLARERRAAQRAAAHRRLGLDEGAHRGASALRPCARAGRRPRIEVFTLRHAAHPRHAGAPAQEPRPGARRRRRPWSPTGTAAPASATRSRPSSRCRALPASPAARSSLILSDGLERGEPERDASTRSRRLARRAWRLVWLSPLAADPDFRPQTAGARRRACPSSTTSPTAARVEARRAGTSWLKRAARRMSGIVDAHHHIWRQADLPWLVGPMQPRIFGPYEPIRRDYPIERVPRRHRRHAA